MDDVDLAIKVIREQLEKDWEELSTQQRLEAFELIRPNLDEVKDHFCERSEDAYQKEKIRQAYRHLRILCGIDESIGKSSDQHATWVIQALGALQLWERTLPQIQRAMAETEAS